MINKQQQLNISHYQYIYTVYYKWLCLKYLQHLSSIFCHPTSVITGNITNTNTEHGNYTYSYDNLDRLTTVDYPTLTDETFTYDALGNRKTDSNMGITQWLYNQNNQLPNSVNNQFTYDANGSQIEEKDVSGQLEKQYLYNTENRLAEINDTNGQTIANYYYYQNDHLGTPNILHDKQGQVVNAREMKAFGEWENSVNSISNGFAFAGQYKDAETNTYYNFHRDYHPSLGRYIESDPIGLDGGINIYEYAFSNPNKFIDPLAKKPPGTEEPQDWVDWISKEHCGKSCQRINKRVIGLCKKMGLLFHACKVGADRWITDCFINGPPGCKEKNALRKGESCDK